MFYYFPVLYDGDVAHLKSAEKDLLCYRGSTPCTH